MNKIKFLIIALAGLIACSCGNREIAFPDGVSNVRHSSGKAISLLPQEHAISPARAIIKNLILFIFAVELLFFKPCEDIYYGGGIQI